MSRWASDLDSCVGAFRHADKNPLCLYGVPLAQPDRTRSKDDLSAGWTTALDLLQEHPFIQVWLLGEWAAGALAKAGPCIPRARPSSVAPTSVGLL